MNEVKHQKWASAFWNGDFYLIETFSGHGLIGRDSQGKQHTLPPKASMQELGEVLLDALAHSRLLSLEDAKIFFDYEKGNEEYATWIQVLMARHGYKTKKALFKNMARCDVELEVANQRIKISPSRHKTLEGWVRTKDDGIEDVYLSADSSPTAIGEALLLAFSRCV